MVTLKGYPSFFSPFKTTGPEPQSGMDLNSAIFRRPYQLVLLHIPTFANWSLKRLILDVYERREAIGLFDTNFYFWDSIAKVCPAT